MRDTSEPGLDAKARRRIERLQTEAGRLRDWLAANSADRKGSRGSIRKSNRTDNESAKMATGKIQVRTLPGADFLHLLLQHVLPKGFRRARNYGFLHPNKKGLIALLHLVLRMAPPTAPPAEKPRPAFPCPCCGQPMQVIRRRIAPAGNRRRATEAATETAV